MKETLGEKLAREARIQSYLKKLNTLYEKDFKRQKEEAERRRKEKRR